MPNNRGGFVVALSPEDIERLLTDAEQDDWLYEEDDDAGYVGGFSDASEDDEFIFASLNHKSHGVQTLVDGISRIDDCSGLGVNPVHDRLDIYPNLV